MSRRDLTTGGHRSHRGWWAQRRSRTGASVCIASAGPRVDMCTHCTHAETRACHVREGKCRCWCRSRNRPSAACTHRPQISLRPRHLRAPLPSEAPYRERFPATTHRTLEDTHFPAVGSHGYSSSQCKVYSQVGPGDLAGREQPPRYWEVQQQGVGAERSLCAANRPQRAGPSGGWGAWTGSEQVGPCGGGEQQVWGVWRVQGSWKKSLG